MGFPLPTTSESELELYIAQDMFQPQQSALLRIICRPKTKGTESFVSVSEKDIQRRRICGVQISGLVGGPSKKMLHMTSFFSKFGGNLKHFCNTIEFISRL